MSVRELEEVVKEVKGLQMREPAIQRMLNIGR
jgi:hypothetical protein